MAEMLTLSKLPLTPPDNSRVLMHGSVRSCMSSIYAVICAYVPVVYLSYPSLSQPTRYQSHLKAVLELKQST